MMNEKKDWYVSSTGKGLSLTIGGLSVAGVVSVAMFIVSVTGLDISQSEVTQIVTMLFQISGSAMALFGLIRKIYYRIKK